LIKEHGGLGVRRLREFNTALLDKWCWRLLVEGDGLWRLLVEGDGLWRRVLVVRYGAEDGRIEVGGRSSSSWWREIVRIQGGVGGSGDGWSAACMSRKVGDGAETSFLAWLLVWRFLFVISFGVFMIWPTTMRPRVGTCFCKVGRRRERRGGGIVVCGYERKSC